MRICALRTIFDRSGLVLQQQCVGRAGANALACGARFRGPIGSAALSADQFALSSPIRAGRYLLWPLFHYLSYHRERICLGVLFSSTRLKDVRGTKNGE